MKAWQFKGNKESYVKLSGKSLDLGSQSFTWAAFIYQDALRDAALMEYRGKAVGTHIWIYQKKLYINLVAAGRNFNGFHVTPVAKKWHFVGASLNAKTGELLMWVDENVMTKNVGAVGKRKMSGDLYIGVRLGENRGFNGKMAGATLMNCGVKPEQVSALKKDVIQRASEYKNLLILYILQYSDIGDR